MARLSGVLFGIGASRVSASWNSGAGPEWDGMKVCLLIESLSVRGGTHKQLLRLAQYLRSSGDRVDIVTREYEPSQCYEEFGGFEIRTAARGVSGRLGRIASGLRLEAMIPEDSDVLNVHDQGCELIVLESLRRRRALPVVWQINDL